MEGEQLLASPFVAIHALPIAGFMKAHDRSRFVSITKLVQAHPGAIEKAIGILKDQKSITLSSF